MSRRQIDPYEIHRVVKFGSLEEVKQVIDSSNINMKYDGINSPLDLAIKNRRKDVIEHLISQGANIEYKSLSLAIENDELDLFQSLLAQRGYFLPNKYQNLILIASRKGDFETLQFLMGENVIFKLKDSKYGNMALLNALAQRNYEVARFLIENGSNVNAQDTTGASPLFKSSGIKGNLEFAQYVIEKGANIDVQNNYGNTPLIVAAANGNKSIVEFLISKHANPFLKWDNGTAWTCL